jgi:hypothetical protein
MRSRVSVDSAMRNAVSSPSRSSILRRRLENSAATKFGFIATVLPTVGKDAGAKLLGPEQAGVALEVIAGNMSSSSDLAYYYGKYSDTRSEGAATGYFLQVWQTNATGAWKLVLDWQKAAP